MKTNIARLLQRASFFAALLVLNSACTVTREFSQVGFEPPRGDYKLIVMQPDISVGLLTAGGLVERSEEWTDSARTEIVAALRKQQAERGGLTDVAETLDAAGGDPGALADLVSLHNAVGQAILTHKVGNSKLPSKTESFDWTLGETAVAYGSATDYDYALFLHAENSFSSGGRRVLQVAGLASCLVGVCAVVGGGTQVAFVTLVDLSSGEVAWFNYAYSEVGDIRTTEGADQLVARLLDSMYVSDAQ